MTITNGYATRLQFQNYIASNATGTTAQELINIQTDDLVIDSLVTDASRVVDTFTLRQFYFATGTFSYNQTAGKEIYFDRDIYSVVSVTNGDGTTVASSEYNLYPLNSTPKYSIRLKQGSTTLWQLDSSGNYEGVVSIVGVEGYSTSIPADIELATLIIAVALYRQRTGQTPLEGGVVTAQGNLLLPSGLPKTATQLLAKYKRVII